MADAERQKAVLEIKIQEHLANIERAARRLLEQRTENTVNIEEEGHQKAAAATTTKTVMRKKKRRKKKPKTLKQQSDIEDVFTTTVSAGITGVDQQD